MRHKCQPCQDCSGQATRGIQGFHHPNINISEIKTLQEKIEGKLKMLNFMVEDTGKILETDDEKAIKRNGSALESIIDKMHQLKLQVQELQIKNNKDFEIKSWSENLEANIDKFEGTQTSKACSCWY